MRRHTVALMIVCLLAATVASAQLSPCYPAPYVAPPPTATVLVGVEAPGDAVAPAVVKEWRVDEVTHRLEVYGAAHGDGYVILGWTPVEGGRWADPVACPVELPGRFVLQNLFASLWPGLEGRGTLWAYATDLAGAPLPLSMAGTEYACNLAGRCRGATVAEVVLPAGEWQLLPVPPGANRLELHVYNPGPAITTFAVEDQWFMPLPVGLGGETLAVSLDLDGQQFLPVCAGCTPPWPIGGWVPQALPIGATFNGSVAVRGAVLPEPR